MAGEAHTTVQQNGGHPKAFPPLDPNTFAPQLIWLAITFGLLYLLMRRIFLPRVDSILDERSGRKRGELALAEKLKRDTEAALAKYEESLTDARSKANAVAKDARDKLTTELDEGRKKVEAQMTAMLSEAEIHIAAAKSEALANVQEIASDIAGAIVTNLIGKEVTKDEVNKALIRRAAE